MTPSIVWSGNGFASSARAPAFQTPASSKYDARPVISTRWRGIPSVVEDGVNGFLTDIQAPQQVAEKLALLARELGEEDEVQE